MYDLIKVQISILIIIAGLCSACISTEANHDTKEEIKPLTENAMIYPLPKPNLKGKLTVEEALSKRRSRRSYQDTPISAEDLSQMLWAAYGVTKPMPGYRNIRAGLRTAPSAGATYPLEIYVLIGNVKGLKKGVYKYQANDHSIKFISSTDKRADLCKAALNQEMIQDAPAVLFYSAIYKRCSQRYGERCYDRYVCMDLGHSAQNVYLQAEALNFGTCAIGAFNDDKVEEVMELPEEEVALYIMPVGYSTD